MKYWYFIFIIVAAFLLNSCKQTRAVIQQNNQQQSWQQQFNEQLPLLGHRNWIIIADKAFPQQNAQGIEVINTNEKLLPVLKYVLDGIKNAAHVKPVVYKDKELSFLTEEMAPGVKKFVEESDKMLGQQAINTVLHDSVFSKLDAVSKLFKILVFKTDETIPYSSIFIELDCAYWNTDKEMLLRNSMQNVLESSGKLPQ